jgi:hypothetical protein
MPGDLVPYKLLSLAVVMRVLVLVYLESKPVLKVASMFGFSYQLVYSVLLAFDLYRSNIYLFLRQKCNADIAVKVSAADLISLVEKPYPVFQHDYINLNCKTTI